MKRTDFDPPPTPQPESDLITPAEAASKLSVSTKTLHRWTEDGLIVKLWRLPNGHRRYSRIEINELLERAAMHNANANDAA
jgi:DNA-binding transcriptional MerR regulator